MTIPADYGDVIAEWGQTITRHRKDGGAHVDGIWVEGAEVDAPLFAVVQPAKPSEIKLLDEGFRNTRVYRLTTEDDLRAGDADNGGVEPDHITYQGDRYVVAATADWRATSGYLEAFVSLRSPVESTP